MVQPVLGPQLAFAKDLSGMKQRISNLERSNSGNAVVSPASSYANATNFGIGTSLAPVVSCTIGVPSGYTTATITMGGQIAAQCLPPSGTTYDYLYSRVYASCGGAAIWSATPYVLCQPTSGTLYGAVFFPVMTPTFSGVMTGLAPEATITFSLEAYTGAGWSASSVAAATIDAVVLFTPQ